MNLKFRKIRCGERVFIFILDQYKVFWLEGGGGEVRGGLGRWVGSIRVSQQCWFGVGFSFFVFLCLVVGQGFENFQYVGVLRVEQFMFYFQGEVWGGCRFSNFFSLLEVEQKWQYGLCWEGLRQFRVFCGFRENGRVFNIFFQRMVQEQARKSLGIWRSFKVRVRERGGGMFCEGQG